MCVRDIDSSPTLTIHRRSDLHEVLGIVYRCEDCTSLDKCFQPSDVSENLTVQMTPTSDETRHSS